MKNLIAFSILIVLAFSLQAQANRVDQLQNLEKSQAANQSDTLTATLKNSTRLFGAKDDLTTVITIIPSGSSVTVLDSDSTYFHVLFEEDEGYIYKRDALINKQEQNTSPNIVYEEAVPQQQPAQRQQVSRFSFLESKYGSNVAARLMAGKIWKGMNPEMVTDSWGRAEKINRVISGNLIKEEWIYNNTWLYFENDVLVEWGPIKK
jgi:hypothetical protein